MNNGESGVVSGVPKHTRPIWEGGGVGRLQAKLAIQLQGAAEMKIPLFKKQAKNTIRGTNI